MPYKHVTAPLTARPAAPVLHDEPGNVRAKLRVNARVGLVKPGGAAGADNVGFWKTHAPEGVEILATDLGYKRGDLSTFSSGLQRASRLAEELASQGSDVVVISGTPPFLLEGAEFEKGWRDALSSRLGTPVITAMDAHARAIRSLAARRVAVATYYGKVLNEAISRYLACYDVEAIPMGGFRLTGRGEGLFSTPMHQQSAITAQQVYEYCRAGLTGTRRPVDALYINGAGWDASPALAALEQDLAIDVIWGPVAEIWRTYGTLGLANPQHDCGRLLRPVEPGGPDTAAPLSTAPACSEPETKPRHGT